MPLLCGVVCSSSCSSFVESFTSDDSVVVSSNVGNVFDNAGAPYNAHKMLIAMGVNFLFVAGIFLT